MNMDVCVKKELQFSRFTGILLPRGNEIHYIGGAEVLPAPLSQEEEAEKLQELTEHGSQQAISCLIEHNLRLVVYIAKKFDNTGVGVEDLISIGTIGLIKAINTFNPVKKIKLATYASRCIENEILMYLRRNSKTKMEVSIDEPLNVDWDGNELLLSDILGTDEANASWKSHRKVDKKGTDHCKIAVWNQYAGWKRENAKRSGRPFRNFPVLHIQAGETDYETPKKRNCEI